MRRDDFTEWTLGNEIAHSRSLVRVFESIREGELAKLCRLADRIEKGNATGSDEEQELVYDNFVELCDQVLDLAHMVRRREEFMIANGIDPSRHSEISFVVPIEEATCTG